MDFRCFWLSQLKVGDSSRDTFAVFPLVRVPLIGLCWCSGVMLNCVDAFQFWLKSINMGGDYEDVHAFVLAS